MDYIKVQDHDSLVRDPKTGAIINANRGEFLKHVEARRKMSRIETVVDDINNLIYVTKKIEKENSAHSLKRKLARSEISVKIIFD